MREILDFLKGLGEIITSLANFVFGLIEDLLYVVRLLGSLVVKIPDMIGFYRVLPLLWLLRLLRLS